MNNKVWVVRNKNTKALISVFIKEDDAKEDFKGWQIYNKTAGLLELIKVKLVPVEEG